MAKRSLKASTVGIQTARKAYNNGGWTQEALAEQVNLKTRQSIGKFFSGKSVDRHVFIEICMALDLNWEAIVEQKTELSSDDSDLDSLVHAMRDRTRSSLRERCGYMRVLDMTQRIGLNDIYISVNILEKLTRNRALEELLRDAAQDPERFGLGMVCEKRVPGVVAVRERSKLMVLGKPGAGKTTFLKHLAIQCIEGAFEAARLPVFITLKEFAEATNQPGLLDFICQQVFDPYRPAQKQDLSALETVLKQGRILILLDGLDEIRKVDESRVCQEIEQLATRFADNQFVITCRIAAREYTFQNFIEVEIADFDKTQILDFVTSTLR